ncbi:hypothetical protein GCM10007977_004810 [Dactylosporangium sucinum]|uniref:Uncharacterized protein n=1 Tax=Dactylosporangium sucinum TaxID=1424081 RepID=A0A917T140_9ACTN|nr:hypothetical protein GCM10007977_004810 [Dactylosporangium sucinum]
MLGHDVVGGVQPQPVAGGEGPGDGRLPGAAAAADPVHVPHSTILRRRRTLAAVNLQDYLAAIIFGAVIGIVARIVLPGRQNIGIILTVLIGMGAAVAGTWAADRWDIHSDKFLVVRGHSYDWLVIGVQVGIAVVGVALAALLAKAFSTDDDDD